MTEPTQDQIDNALAVLRDTGKAWDIVPTLKECDGCSNQVERPEAYCRACIEMGTNNKIRIAHRQGEQYAHERWEKVTAIVMEYAKLGGDDELVTLMQGIRRECWT